MADGSSPRSEAWLERAAARADPDLPPRVLPRALLADVLGHARECHPEECCGLLVGTEDSRSWRAVRCANVQSARRARGDSDLDASQAFWIDEQQLLELLGECDARGESLRAVYHSHVDTAAYLSHTDLDSATTTDGQPLWPGVAHLVVSAWGDGVREAVWFDWDPGEQRFRGRPAQGG